MHIWRRVYRTLAFFTWTALIVIPALPASMLYLAAGSARRRIVMARFTRLWCRGLLRVFNVKIRTSGRFDSFSGGRFIVANHLGYLEVLIIGSLVPVTFIAKHEVRRWPVLGALAMLASTFFVKRTRRMKSGDTARLLSRDLKRGVNYILFAEGTTSKGDTVLPFKSSLFAAPLAARSPLHPAGIWYALLGDGDEPSRRHRACWYGDQYLVPHLNMLLAADGVEAIVRFGEVIPLRGTSPDSRSRKELAQLLHRRVLDLYEKNMAMVYDKGTRNGTGEG